MDLEKWRNQTLDKPPSREASLFELTPSVARLITSPTLGINNYVKDQRSKGKFLVHFGLGESPFGAPQVAVDALKKHAHRTSYLPSEGIRSLRTEISGFYKRYFDLQVSPEQIIIGPGSKELIYITMTALRVPWVIPRPSWVSYVTQTRILGRTVFQPHATDENHYRITESLLRKTLNEIQELSNFDQFIILLNYPNNPTGLTLSKHEVKRIARFARNNDLLILSDEIYANITHRWRGESHYSMALEYPEGTIVTGGISKDRSMGGWRLGVAILPENEPELLRAFKAIGSETYSCVAAPIQFASIELFKENEEIDRHIKDSSAIHELIGNWVWEQLREAGYHVPRPEGAFYLLPSLNHKRDALNSLDIQTSRELVQYLLEKYFVTVLDGTAFGLPQEDLAFRLAYVDYDGPTMLQQYRANPDEAQNNPEEFIRSHASSVYFGVKQLQEFAFSL